MAWDATMDHRCIQRPQMRFVRTLGRGDKRLGRPRSRCHVLEDLRVFWLGKTGAASEPVSEPGFVDIPGGDGQHGLLGVIDIGKIGFPPDVIEIEEQNQRSPCRSLVAVWQGVVPGQAARQHGGFVGQVRRTLDSRSWRQARVEPNRPGRCGSPWIARWPPRR